MPLTPDQLRQLTAINLGVNALPYEEAIGAHETIDWWTDEPVSGQSWVCRDYVLAKADRLRVLGWPATDLRVLLCWSEPVGNPPERGYHAVLAVGQEPDVTILDSRFDDPYPMANPPVDYVWDRIQVPGGTDFEPVG